MIELPPWAVPNSASPSYIDFGGLLTPGLGGAVQRIDRMGNRFRIAIGFPPMASADRGRVLLSRLLRAKTEGIRIEFPLLGFKPGAPGAPKVNGAGQKGRTLIADGFTPNYAIREGQWFSLEHEGQHYLHNVDAEVLANAAGQATLSISPMLRVEPSDNATLHFARPMIQGFVQGERWDWEMSLAHHLGLSADIEEAA
jgi:hypothetical protein